MFRDWIQDLASKYANEVALEGGWPTPNDPILQIRYFELPNVLNRVGVTFPQTGIISTRAATSLAHALTLFASAFRNLTPFPLNFREPKKITGQLALQYGVSLIWEEQQIFPIPSAPKVNDYLLQNQGFLIATSGSSGKPKVAFLTWKSFIENAIAANQRVPIGVGDKWFVDLPLWHVSGLGAFVRALQAGATACFPGGVEETATHRSCVPTQLRRWLNRGTFFPYLREILVGGAPFPSEMRKEAAAKGWPVRPTYGLTEASSQVCTASKLQPQKLNLDSVGKPLACWEIRLQDSEVCIRGTPLFSGYTTPEKELILPFDSEGWFATGDLGQWNDQGELQIIGRRDRMFVSGGENIYPERIEAAFLTLPGVQNVHVTSIADQEYGQRPVVFIEGNGQVDYWRELLREKLNGLEVPLHWYRWPFPSSVSEEQNAQQLKPRADFFRELLVKGQVGAYKLEEIG